MPSNPEAIRTLKSLGLSAGRTDPASELDASLDRYVSGLKRWERASAGTLTPRAQADIREAITTLERSRAKDRDFLTFDANDDIPDELVYEMFAKMLPDVLRDEIQRALNDLTGRVND